MNRKPVGLAFSFVGAILLVGASMVGCGGGGSKGDGGTMYPDATVNFDTKGDHTTSTDTGVDTGPPAPPPIGMGSKLIVTGTVDLIGSGADSCTNQVPPSGDRWCGFARLGSDLMNFDLWVVNVTKAAQGVAIQCTATVADPNCLRLSTGLYADATNGFRIHGFDGDTLTFSEVPSQSANGFLGNIFAWRPGWTAPHNLTGNQGLVCNGNKQGRGVACIVNPMADSTQSFVHTAELHAGILDDAGTALPKIATLILVANQAEVTNGVTKWGAKLSPDGQAVAWSTRATDTGTEDLHWQSLTDSTKPVVDVATDVSQWQISSDSQRWFWLKSYNYGLNGTTAAAPSGTLQSAVYPDPTGTTPVTIASAVGDYNEAGQGLSYRTQVTSDTGVGNLLITPNRDMPATVAMVDTAVQFVFATSSDGKSVTYTKNVQQPAMNVFLFDAYVGNSAGTMPCTLTAMATAFLPPTFLAANSLVSWGHFNTQTQQIEGLATTLPGCATRKFASDIYDWSAVGDEGLVYLDTLDPDPALNEATLRYGKVQQGVLPATGTVIQLRSGLSFSTLLPALDAVVYTITTNTSADGLYINTALPFTVTTSVPDAGTPPPDATPDMGAVDTGSAADTGAVDNDAGQTGNDADQGG
jgi:hypothetical protein